MKVAIVTPDSSHLSIYSLMHLGLSVDLVRDAEVRCKLEPPIFFDLIMINFSERHGLSQDEVCQVIEALHSFGHPDVYTLVAYEDESHQSLIETWVEYGWVDGYCLHTSLYDFIDFFQRCSTPFRRELALQNCYRYSVAEFC